MSNPWSYGDEAQKQEAETEAKICMEIVAVLSKHKLGVDEGLTILAKVMTGLIISGVIKKGRLQVFHALSNYIVSLLKRDYPDES